MKTRICHTLGIEVPIFAFSHCRDVVVEVSKAGGLGVLGVTYKTAADLEQELRWIDDHIGGKPYGIDVLIPNKYEKTPHLRVEPTDLPKAQVEFMRRVLDEAGIPRLPPGEGEAMVQERLDRIHMTPEHVAELMEVALRHPIKVVVNALGVPPNDEVARLHGLGIKVGSMVGKVEHAINHKAAGVDFVVAQGMEAAGHTGKITSMLLWPQVIDAVRPLPVLAAGGIVGGRQMAAAMAMGADGVWCGSVWLGTRESEVLPEVKQRFYKATSEDTVQSRLRSGKPARVLRSKLSDAWERKDSPGFAPMPYQTMLMVEPHIRVERGDQLEWKYYPVGQAVGMMNEEASCKQVIYDMMDEFIESTQALCRLMESD